MDAFQLCKSLISDYSEYVSGFLNIRDERLKDYVDRFLSRGSLWPEARVQLNPAYEKGATVEDLVREGLLHPDCTQIFRTKEGKTFHLYRHQEEAIRKAAKGESYVLTTGTGSGKSLCFFIPIVDYVLKNDPQDKRVRAIIVYPMNALINSQLEGFKNLLSNLPGCPVTVVRYTSQEDAQTRERLQKNPPHILLTNYVMLELMLARHHEQVFVDQNYARIKFLVFDELHTYTGRQGADVALLIRRLAERTGNQDLILIGTSATLATEGDRFHRKEVVAQVASNFFGRRMPPENVIDETLKRVTCGHFSKESLREALASPPPPEDISLDEFLGHPVAAWIEDTFGLTEKDGYLMRREPITLSEGAKKLAEETGVSEGTAVKYLQHMFNLGSRLNLPDGTTVFPFKLHQFVAQGENILATLEKPSTRFFTAEVKNFAPDVEGLKRPLFPLVFCRECGQEYYQVVWDTQENQFLPLEETLEEEAEEIQAGYLIIEEEPDTVWNEASLEELPDTWKTPKGKISKKYEDHVPRRVWVTPDGKISFEETEDSAPGWFVRYPFLFCLNCGIVYTRKEREFKKLARFSSEGRSTATTLLSVSTIVHLRKQGISQEACKLLSFTDNRQDASLQAGHFNDFVQVALIRSGVYRALEEARELTHENIAIAVYEALNLPQEMYAKEPAEPGTPGFERKRRAFIRLLEYRIVEDLRRGWRVVQPNLEQVGLLKIEYYGLREICHKDSLFQAHPLLAKATPEKRFFVVKNFLDFMRQALAIDAHVLTPEAQESLLREVRQEIKEPWNFADDEILRRASWFVIDPYYERGENEWSLSARSKLGRFLRSPETWDGLLTKPLSEEEYHEEFLPAFVDLLIGCGFVRKRPDGKAIQVQVGSIVWQKGTGEIPAPDPIRSKWLKGAESDKLLHRAHPFFVRLYRELASEFKNLQAAEHTGQIGKEVREKREKLFRKGEVPVLYCSPTMELGIDIADLNVVHMRNVPPSPANYAQRSGRAGRGGQPAVVITYCAAKSPHDQYFFHRPVKMIAGAVTPPRFDLSNEDMLREHLHAIWLAKTGLNLGHSIGEILDLKFSGYPLHEDIKKTISDPRYIEAAFEEAKRLIEREKRLNNEEEKFFPDEKWIKETLERAPELFDKAFDRWRTLYHLAEEQIRKAQDEILKLPMIKGNRKKMQERRQKAERMQREALRQIELLLNQAENTESDFYPYRYLACEGFLPGYNFPRLPIRAYLSVGEQGEFITRPRFLAIREFAPFNLIYHEGQIFMVDRVQMPLSQIHSRLKSVRLCKQCGYIHEIQEIDCCENCGVSLNAETSITTDCLFDLPDVVAIKRRRITCDEEERVRLGYKIDTFFRYSVGKSGIRKRGYKVMVGREELFRATFGPSATLWLVNQGWLQSKTPRGFLLDFESGKWLKDSKESDLSPERVKRVLPFTRDTKNILLIQPIAPEHREEAILASFQAATLSAIETYFQLAEGEISATRLGEGEQKGILFWEASEGSLGVLRRLVDEPDIFRKLTHLALEICHFSPEGDDLEPKDSEERCTRACYRCLLSYQNQPDHLILDRFLIRDLLLKLREADLVAQDFSSREEQYHFLLKQIDPRSSLEKRFLEYLYKTGRKLPDEAQKLIIDENLGLKACPDFYYRAGNVCIFCDGSIHDEKRIQERDYEQRKLLEEAGYLVISIKYDEDLEDQINRYPNVFGL